MQKTIIKPKEDDYIFAEDKPAWLNTPSPFDGLDDDWLAIIVFYVFHVPVSDLSARARTLESYQWGQKSKNNDFKQLKRRFVNYGNMSDESFICEDGWAKLKESIQSNNLQEFPCQLDRERVVYRKSKTGVNDSLLAHIRNAFAHGRIALYTFGGNEFVALEDIDDKKHVAARMILSKETLLRWKTIINAGPFTTTDQLDKEFGLEGNNG